MRHCLCRPDRSAATEGPALLSLTLLLALGACHARGSADVARPNPAARTYALVNGNWLSGNDFTRRNFFAVDGILRTARPAVVDSTIDLAGMFVIPPFGDAHSHNLSFALARQDSVRDAYLAEGTFYVQVLGNSIRSADAVRATFNHPCTLDVTYANAMLTSTLGHGFEVGEALAMGFRDPWAAIYGVHSDSIKKSRLAEYDRYVLLDSVVDVATKWPRIVDAHPDIIKISIIGLPDTAGRAPMWPSRMYFMHGLSERVAQEVVARAHAAHLRVAAHVETARDFEAAVDVGADVIAHMLGPDFLAGDEGFYRISDRAARLAAARGVVVIPTVAITNDVVADSAHRALVHRLQRDNLRLLARYGVPLLIGRDEVWHTAREELVALRGLGVFDDSTFLRMWSETTPRSIFPGRRIGRLSEGSEASFLALRENPLGMDASTARIALRMKQGCVLP